MRRLADIRVVANGLRRTDRFQLIVRFEGHPYKGIREVRGGRQRRIPQTAVKVNWIASTVLGLCIGVVGTNDDSCPTWWERFLAVAFSPGPEAVSTARTRATIGPGCHRRCIGVCWARRREWRGALRCRARYWWAAQARLCSGSSSSMHSRARWRSRCKLRAQQVRGRGPCPHLFDLAHDAAAPLQPAPRRRLSSDRAPDPMSRWIKLSLSSIGRRSGRPWKVERQSSWQDR